MQLYDRGIRRRLAPMLGGDRRRLELAYSLMCTLPGTPVIRYGDEIGMGDDLALPERNCARTPMQWSTEPQAVHQERQSRSPVIDQGALRLRARQRREAAPRSELAAELDRAHHPHAQGSAGDRLGRLQVIATRDPPCWRCATTGATTRCCSCTISTRSRARCRSRSACRRSRKASGQSAVGRPQPGRQGGRHTDAGAYGYRWYRVGGLDYLLKRSDIDYQDQRARPVIRRKCRRSCR